MSRKIVPIGALLALCLAVAPLTPAAACGGSRYDHAAELKAIDRGLRQGGLPRETAAQVGALRAKAGVSPASLTPLGLMMQDGHRGEALRLLRLERIPAARTGPATRC